jgi:site-specific recombinase XerD
LKDFQEFIDYKKDNQVVTKETIKTYNTTLNKLSQFQEKTNYLLHYDRINNEFNDKFLNFLREQNLMDNSVDKHIKNLKLFMYYALSKEKHNNNVFQTFKRTKTKADFVVLEVKELQKLYYDYKPKDPKHKAIRDTFVLGCSTGLRFGDLTNLSRGDFYITRDINTKEILQSASDSFIRVPTQKTTEIVKIPLNPFICELIDEYSIENQNGRIPFLKHNPQVFNREIKKICEEAGITSIVKVSKKKNSVFITKEEPKYKFISSHTMRRTFITILSSMTEISNIQAVSGHKDIKILSDYIKRNDKELNSVRACFNDVFYKSEKENSQEMQSSQPVKVRATPIKTRIITH